MMIPLLCICYEGIITLHSTSKASLLALEGRGRKVGMCQYDSFGIKFWYYSSMLVLVGCPLWHTMAPPVHRIK